MLATVALFPLQACSFLTLPERAKPPANLTAECPALTEQAVADLGDLLQVCVDDASLYRQCAARHKALAKWATQ